MKWESILKVDRWHDHIDDFLNNPKFENIDYALDTYIWELHSRVKYEGEAKKPKVREMADAILQWLLKNKPDDKPHITHIQNIIEKYNLEYER